MAFTTIIHPDDLLPHLGEPDWAVLDCRFNLRATDAGRAAYAAGHVAGALYAHLDDDLSGPIVPGRTGRHPLPRPEDVARTLSAWGIDDEVQVVAYDDAGGAYAARLWWLLAWLGHPAAAVLDGGWTRWKGLAYPARDGVEERAPRTFTPRARTGMVATAAEVDRLREDPAARVVDARTAARFRGENETIDPVAGHIPGAICLPHQDNVTPDGRFRPAAELAARYRDALGETPPERTVFYCGSGVTAAHDVLAMAHAGLGIARLYPGSWSEWITDPSRPVASG